MSEFKVFGRGEKETILLIPGWATDYRVFSPLNLRFNYLVALDFSLKRFEKDLLNALEKNSLKKISILGWSLGGFLALGFLSRYPENVNEVLLVSVRKRYENDMLENVKKALKKNRRAFLYKFYKDFFSRNEIEESNWFKKNLLKSYLNDMMLDSLLDGLNYLSGRQIVVSIDNSVKIRFVHGTEDKVTPIEELKGLRNDFLSSEFIFLKGTGHMPFLSPGFERVFR